jgi:predicted enzyme related to lactoylglutathione lyase
VDDLDAYRDAAKKKNVKEVFPSADTPMCRMAVMADPDGNWIALHQRKAEA